jgi:hypothetical protein
MQKFRMNTSWYPGLMCKCLSTSSEIDKFELDRSNFHSNKAILERISWPSLVMELMNRIVDNLSCLNLIIIINVVSQKSCKGFFCSLFLLFKIHTSKQSWSDIFTTISNRENLIRVNATVVHCCQFWFAEKKLSKKKKTPDIRDVNRV